MARSDLLAPCPCDSGIAFGACCAPVHHGRPARTAEELMRSRYTAYVVDDADHLFRTWHPRTRPPEVTAARELTWTGLSVVRCVDGGVDDETGLVEFEARWTSSGGPGSLHETSRFERRRAVWVYVEAL